jgi:SAM-dependent methyltransferase
MPACTVCGGNEFVHDRVLWDGLIAEWQLGPDEADYIDRQQGTHCVSCGANLRSVALANAIRASVGTSLTLGDFVVTPPAQPLGLLEINGAGSLSPVLQRLPRHTLGCYPEVDMHALPYPAATFDLVVHSDTLEHVAHPVRALTECCRVLKPGGAVCFTVPTIVGRLTRNRAGLPKSYHGTPETARDDFLVHTEFGADVWTYVMKAGFDAVSMHAVEYPCAFALAARRV